MITKEEGNKYGNHETVVKITSKDKDFLDQLIEYLGLTFDCELTSPKMWDEKSDHFFQYIAVHRRA